MGQPMGQSPILSEPKLGSDGLASQCRETMAQPAPAWQGAPLAGATARSGTANRMKIMCTPRRSICASPVPNCSDGKLSSPAESIARRA